MTSSDNIQDSVLQAIAIVAEAAIKENLQEEDKTLWTCKIIDDSNKKNGEYRVTDGSVSFYAYSADTSYVKDDSVAVLVPKGDFKNVKYITQKVLVESS